MQQHRRVATITATIILTITASIALAGVDAGVATADVRHAAASSWSSASATTARARDVEQLKALASSLDGGVLASAGDGRSIDVDGETRIGVVPTSSGALCYSVEERGATTYRGCGEDFALDGTAAAYTYGGGDPVSLIGLVAQDVTSVTLETSDGATHVVRIVDGAVAWRAPAGTRIVSLTTVRDGTRHVETDRFASLRD